MKLTINPEFYSLIPPISQEEYQLLEESILNEGCRDPIITWDEVILDGHNRYEICTKNDIKFKQIDKTFENENEAKIWIINNQLGRKNMSPEQISYLRGIRYNLEKKQGERTDLTSDQNDQKSTAEKIAQETGVSAPTIRRDAQFAEAVDKLPPEEKKKVLAGKSKKTKKEIVETSMKKDFKPTVPSKKEPEESDALFQLKKWWKRGTKKDQKSFLNWVKNN